MMQPRQLTPRVARIASIAFLLAAFSYADAQGSLDNQKLNDLLGRTAIRTSSFLEQFSDVKCTEQVRQEKLGKDDKLELKEDSTYDYLAILSNAGGDLSLTESRLPVHQPKRDRKNTPMLVSNGFATLFLVFHPYYSSAFIFSFAGQEEIAGRSFAKIHFQHIPGMKSPAALSLRGREYPLELSGTAWIDPLTGSIARIESGIADSLQDVGLKSFNSQIEFAPLKFSDSRQEFWFPTQARVEVETPRQHWRNLHQFSAYKKFSVTTEETVAQK